MLSHTVHAVELVTSNVILKAFQSEYFILFLIFYTDHRIFYTTYLVCYNACCPTVPGT